MKLLGFMLLVLLVEYTFGATELDSNPTKINGGNEMRLNMMGFAILPEKLGNVDIETPSLTVDDMIRTISYLDNHYDYKIYKEFKEQYIVVALLKGQNDTMLDMQYMTLNNIKSWYIDKLDEVMGRTREDI